MSDTLSFVVLEVTYDSRPGRERLEKDVRRLVKQAEARKANGDHAGGRALAHVALQYFQALQPLKRSPGPS